MKDDFIKTEQEVRMIFNKLWFYRKNLDLISESENYYPYQSGNLIRERTNGYRTDVPSRIKRIDRYTRYINDCLSVIDSLDEESKQIMTKTFLEGNQSWWHQAYMSKSSYYRKRRKAILAFYYLYKAL